MKPIIINSDDRNSGFLYIQLYNTIKEGILSGETKAGEKLPSLRKLASDLKLSITTVDLAFNQLVVEGYVTNIPQRGFFVNEIKSAGTAFTPDVKDEGETITDVIEEDAPYIYDPACFDFNKWKKCSSRVFNEYSDALLFESDPQGELALRQEISKYLFHFRGVNAPAERIVIGAGTQQMTAHLVRILNKMGIRLVSTESPGYLPVQSVFEEAGFNVYPIPVKKDGLDISKLPTNISSAVYVSPSNQFPTGAVMPVGRRYELLEWASANSSIIIEDDYDSELRYFGKPVPALQGLDKDNRVVYLGSFSSTLFPAIKISYMVLPDELSRIFSEIKSQYSQTCSKAEQLTLAFFMEEGYYYTGIRKLRKLYTEKLEKVLEAIGNHANDMIIPEDNKSGISLTIHVKSDKSSDELASEAASIGLTIVPIFKLSGGFNGSSSDNSDSSLKSFSFYYSRVPLDEIDLHLKRLRSVWTA